MPKYIFSYFDGRARGELTRLTLALKGEEFEEKRFSFKTWPAEKPNTPFGQLPVLTIDGKVYTESMAIPRFLAREFGFYGSNNQESFEIDQLIGVCQDLFTAWAKAFFDSDKEKQVKLLKELEETTIPRYMGIIEELMAAKGTGYCVGNKLSLGDLAILDIVDGRLGNKDLAKYPNIKKIVDNVRSNDNIKKYLAARKETTF